MSCVVFHLSLYLLQNVLMHKTLEVKEGVLSFFHMSLHPSDPAFTHPFTTPLDLKSRGVSCLSDLFLRSQVFSRKKSLTTAGVTVSPDIFYDSHSKH